MSSIRNKSAGRGLVIGAIDGMASKIGIKVGARTLGGKAYGVGKKVKATGQVAAIEAAGGSLGEIGGRLAADQEMDAAEVLFEGFAGTATLPATLGIAAYKSPKYYINKGNFDESQKDLTRVDPEIMEDLVYNSTDEEFAAAEITIKNNPELEKVAADRKKKLHSKSTAQKEILDANPKLSQEKLDKLVPLQEELNSLEGNKSQPAKKRRAEIIEQMNAVEEAKETKVEETEITEEEIDKKLKELKPNTDTATAEERAYARNLVAKDKRDAAAKVAETETETETEITATPETKEEAQDLAEAVALDTEETVTNEQGEVVGEKVDEGEAMIRYGEESEQDLFAPLDFENTNNTTFGPAPANLAFFGPANRAGTYKADGTRNKFTATITPKNPYKVEKSDVWTVEKLQPIIDAGHDAIVVTNPVAPETIVLDKSIIKLTAPTELKTKTDATTKQSTTKVDGKKQAKPISKVSKRNTKRKKSTRKKVKDKAEQQKQDTQKKTKIKELKAIAPNAYVNESDKAKRINSEKFIKPAKRALAALKKLLPDVMVVIHENEVDYMNAIGNPKGRSAGVFRGDNVIHINAELANDRVLSHEIFHAILRNKLGSESKIAVLTDRMMKALAKADLDPEIKKKIDKYIALYKEKNKDDASRLAYVK